MAPPTAPPPLPDAALGAPAKQRIAWKDLLSVKWELLVVASSIALFFVSLANAPWEVVLPLAGIILAVSAVLVASDVWYMVKTRKLDRVHVVLVVLDGVVVAASIGILYLWGQVQYDQVADSVTGVAYGLDTIMLVVSITTTAGRLVIRARERRRGELEAEMLGRQGESVAL